MPTENRTPAPRTSGEIEAIAATAAYRELIDRLRQRIRDSHAHAAQAVNTELVTLYWSIGREILDQQQAAGWGENIVGRIAQDLAAGTGSARGFSRRNLFYMRRFAALWPEREIVPSVMAQIGWTAHRVLLDSFGEQPGLYVWYAEKLAENRWGVRHLKGQIDLRLHERRGAAVTNFAAALPPGDASRALEAVKDPYVFDFLELSEHARERQLEQALIDDVQKFLLELGAGFAFYGRQRSLLVGGVEFFPDLLFYHHTLRRFVVLELKIGAFQVEYVSKLNFYLGAVDEQLRRGDDRESVGIILCTERNATVAKLALNRVCAPIAISTWRSDAGIRELASPARSRTLPDGQEDLADLAELDEVGARLVERVRSTVATATGTVAGNSRTTKNSRSNPSASPATSSAPRH
jgi:predicted nuclease of restriction endonuclease-like (RecB) superfamily